MMTANERPPRSGGMRPPSRVLVGVIATLPFALIVALAWLLQQSKGLSGFRDTLFSLLQITAMATLPVLMGLALAAYVVRSLKRRAKVARAPTRLTVLPFHTGAGDQSFDGLSIADLLVAEFDRIRDIHVRQEPGGATDVRLNQPEIQSESLTMPSSLSIGVEKESLATSEADVGTVGIGPTQISLRWLIIAVRRAWPFAAPEVVITGALHHFPPLMQLVVRMDSGEGRASAWEANARIEKPEDIPTLVRQIAYQLVKDLDDNKEITARTATAFGHFTDALDGYYRFRHSRQRADLESARIACLKATAIEPRYQKAATLFYGLGIAFLNMGEDSEAEEMFEHAHLADPADIHPLLGLGIACSNQHRHDDAVEVFTRAAKVFPRSAHAWNNLGDVYRLQGRFDDAIRACNKALSLDSSFAFAWLTRGNAHAGRGEWSGAIADYRRALKIDQRAVEEERQPPEFYPVYGYAWNALADVYAKRRQYGKAVEAHSKAIDFNPRDAYFWHVLGDICRLQRCFEKAINAHKRAIKLNEKFAYPWASLGETYYELGRYEQALDAFGHAIDLYPAFAHAQSGMGRVYAALGRYEEALKHHRRAFELAPDDWRYFASVASTLLRQGSVEKARLYYARSIECSDDVSVDAHVGLGLIAWEQGDTDVATGHMRDVLRVWEKAWHLRVKPDPDLLEAKAMALLLLGDAARAIETLREAVEQLRRLGSFESHRVGFHDLLAKGKARCEGVEEYVALVEAVHRPDELRLIPFVDEESFASRDALQADRVS
jgi:tetratricopeptide (TPR) repeat protein